MSPRLDARWADLAAELGWEPSAAAPVGADIVERYGEPQRHYHTTAHLTAVLDVLDDLAAPSTPLPTTRLAAWFHDAVYDPTRSDNEELSAALASTSLADLPLDPAAAALVADLVLATKAHAPGDLPEADLLLDADLSVLGAPAPVYDRYRDGIRREYAHVPDDLYLTGRSMVLQTFLDREHIFLTPAGRDRFEATARDNLAREIAELGAP